MTRKYKMLYRGRPFGTCHADSPMGALSVCAINAKHRFGLSAFVAFVVVDCAVVDILAAESAFLAQMAGPVKRAAIKWQSRAMWWRALLAERNVTQQNQRNARYDRKRFQANARAKLELLKCKP